MSCSITSRDDLSFTCRDHGGRLVNWPRNNPGVSADWDRGIGFVEAEIMQLAANDETEACHALECALIGMGGRYTSLETGFIYAMAKAAVVGMRAMRDGAQPFEPVGDCD